MLQFGQSSNLQSRLTVIQAPGTVLGNRTSELQGNKTPEFQLLVETLVRRGSLCCSALTASGVQYYFYPGNHPCQRRCAVGGG